MCRYGHFLTISLVCCSASLAISKIPFFLTAYKIDRMIALRNTSDWFIWHCRQFQSPPLLFQTRKYSIFQRKFEFVSVLSAFIQFRAISYGYDTSKINAMIVIFHHMPIKLVAYNKKCSFFPNQQNHAVMSYINLDKANRKRLSFWTQFSVWKSIWRGKRRKNWTGLCVDNVNLLFIQ